MNIPNPINWHLQPGFSAQPSANASCCDFAAGGVGSRSALYRRTGELRLDLTARGLGPAWDGFRAA